MEKEGAVAQREKEEKGGVAPTLIQGLSDKMREGEKRKGALLPTYGKKERKENISRARKRVISKEREAPEKKGKKNLYLHWKRKDDREEKKAFPVPGGGRGKKKNKLLFNKRKKKSRTRKGGSIFCPNRRERTLSYAAALYRGEKRGKKERLSFYRGGKMKSRKGRGISRKKKKKRKGKGEKGFRSHAPAIE